MPVIHAQSETFSAVESFLDRITDSPWLALVELLLIGSVVYTVLRFLRGTRGARLVRAVLTILAVSFAIVWLIAERIESARIKVLYPYFVLGVFLVSLVAFQQELRRILLRVGEGRWLHWFVKLPDLQVDPIVRAVERLSNKKIGALMAVQRSAEIGQIAETGVAIDALVTSELLETIFWPGTALHDLGVIIARGRIVAAGCQFPLAESGEVDRSLGSRHRAGVGMSQEADGVVVIVSEETGTVSLAIRGRLQRTVTAQMLRAALERTLTARPARHAETASGEETASPVTEVSRDGTGQAA